MTERNQSGALCVRKPWPGIARTIYGNHQRYIDTYFKPYQGILTYCNIRILTLTVTYPVYTGLNLLYMTETD